MEERREKKIRFGMALIMILVAAGFDALQWVISALPGGILITPLVTVFAWFIFAIWFKHLDASVMRYSPLSYFGLLPLELISFLNLIPATIAMVLFSILAANRKEV